MNAAYDATYSRTPEGRASELIWAADRLVAELQRLRLDPSVKRAEAVTRHLHGMARTASLLTVALSQEVCA
ncbi:hypothetical protein DSC_11440 [Pseudoxanthomonas spadix BD-a59]|uniref:Uncharacterized protein n=1 Tax=Pseudoxanthomonas spadix (strain BD-a59) TaxID=1045855 RepID=G7UQ48_PSEUP|nr:hypothetical protein [Pseudoxanthomonas spadix]AER56932.1 hypothetical protein DSC_11440 [Pseudoxanthomonas spadix BD-a59]